MGGASDDRPMALTPNPLGQLHMQTGSTATRGKRRTWAVVLALLAAVAVIVVAIAVTQAGKGKGRAPGSSPSAPLTTQSVKVDEGLLGPSGAGSGTDTSQAAGNRTDGVITVVAVPKDKATVTSPPPSVAAGLFRPVTAAVGSACRAQDLTELEAAIEDDGCALIQLTGSRYEIDEELVVRRSLTIVGNPATLPYLDAGDAIRGVRVTRGASLELRYVRIKQGRGIIRSRAEFNLRRQVQEGQGVLSSPELFGPDKMIEIRGGSVYFETGALGGTFVGVFFIQDESSSESVEEAVLQTTTNTGMRIYGGHVYIAGGRLSFNGCLFFDVEVLTALNDRIYLGGDVLILAGEVDFNGCAWIYTTIFGTENGAGFNIAVLGGVISLSYCFFQENTVAAAYNGVGQAFFIAGGVQVVTGCSFALFTALELFTGTGDFTVLAGVLVMTGVAVNDILGIIAAYGAGFDFTVGAGFMIQTGCSLNQWTGPGYTSATGGYTFVGAGEHIVIGSQYSAYSSIAHENGSGGIYWVGAGIFISIGSVIIDMAGIYASELLGEYNGVGSGFMIIIGSPTVEISGIEYYTGLGGTSFVGAGAAVLGRSPLIEFISMVNKHKDWWIQGTCEPFEGAWAKGPVFYVPPATVCPPPIKNRHELLALSGNETVEGTSNKIGLIAWDLKKIRVNLRDEEGRRLLAGLLDGSTFQAAERMQAVLEPDRPGTTVTPASVHIQNKMMDYCGVCGTADLGGPGAGSCTYEASCSQLQTPIGTPGNFTEEGVDSEHFLVLMDVEVALPLRRLESVPESVPLTDSSSTATVEGSTAAPSIQSSAEPSTASKSLEDCVVLALRGAMGADAVRDPTDYLKELALQVKVYSAEIDPYYHTTSEPSYAPLPKSPTTRRRAAEIATSHAADVQRYKAVVVLTDKAQADGLKDTLDKEATDEVLATALQSSLQSQGVESQWTAVSMDRVIHVPAYNTQAWKQSGRARMLELGAYSVALIDPDAPARPVTHVQFGKMYELELRRFGPNKIVQITAVATTGEEATLITTVTTDVMGRAEATITFDFSALPPGDHYIKATEATPTATSATPTAAYGFTPVLDFSAEAKRRLYGKSMRF